MWPQLLDIFPGQEPIERSSMNSWEDEKFVAAVKVSGRKKLVMATLWTEVCLAFRALGQSKPVMKFMPSRNRSAERSREGRCFQNACEGARACH